MRAKFVIKIYDADLKEHTLGPIVLDVAEHPELGGWEWCAAIEGEAARVVRQDLAAEFKGCVEGVKTKG